MNDDQPFIPSFGSFFILIFSAAILYFCGKETGYTWVFLIGIGSFAAAGIMFLNHCGDLYLRQIFACILSFGFALGFLKLALNT